MKISTKYPLAVLLWATLARTSNAACPDLKASYPAPIVRDGWEATLIANDLTAPRGIVFDSEGGLLVVDKGVGIVRYEFTDGGSGCLEVSKKTTLVTYDGLNHGIALSTDGKTLYASGTASVYAWEYDAKAPSVSDTNQTIVDGMNNGDHTTRTLLISEKEPGLLLVSRGSNSNIDLQAEVLATGRSQIKAFKVDNFTSTSKPYDYATSGTLLGWGLRNSVGVAEEPLTGGIYSVENSVDEIERDGVDIHQNNPGEEMNFHGYLNGSTEHQGGNYGYPYCFALWNTSIPNVDNLTTGSQFTLDQNATINDAFCANDRVPPRLTFQAHMAPLDLKFFRNGTTAFVSFHGSWDRSAPVGYKVSSIAFSNGSPVDKANSMTAATDIFANADNSKCPDDCFRPVGLAFDSKDRLFVSSDATHEIYVLVKTSITSSAPSGTASGTATSTSPTASPTKNGAQLGIVVSASAWMIATLCIFVQF